MKNHTWTVATLAAASDLDVEQVLVSLWSEGIEYPLEPKHRIKPIDSKAAERAVGLTNLAQKRVTFWLTELQMSRQEFGDLLAEWGLVLGPKAQTLPKGAVRRIRARFAIDASRTVASDPKTAVSPLKTPPPFKWHAPGTPRDCEHLTADELLQVHEALTEEFASTDDPISPPGLKSRSLLESAAGRPGTGFEDAAKYPTIESAAAALLHSVVHNHPFHNGNKRTALVSALVLLDRHDIMLDSTENELFRFMVKVAAHDLLPAGFLYDQKADREVEVIARWIRDRTHVIRREERSITWRDLQRKLKQRHCEVHSARGEKVRISRRVEGRRRFLGTRRSEVLETFYINTSDGREVPRTIVKKIRKDLMLDLEHGVDAEAFYGDHKGADFFIAEYSGLLRRLARV